MIRAIAIALLAAALGGGCRRSNSDGPSKEEAEKIVRAYEAKKKELAERPPKQPASKSSSGSLPSSASSASSASEGLEEGVFAAPSQRAKLATTAVADDEAWFVDEPIDIAPAGPVTATALGAILYDRENDVHVARRGGLSRRTQPMKTPVSRLPNDGTRFPLGRGPAIAGDYAYWISDGKLLRRRFTGGETAPLEVLASDARTGTRVAAVLGKDGNAARPTSVAYIRRPDKEDGPLKAKLWVEGGKTTMLTSEGSSANGVSLAPTKDGLLAISMQARMAMTPVHARRVRFEGRTPVPSDDLVVWVGGGVQQLTELTTLASGSERLWGFIPHERSITEFGLCKLDIGLEPDMDTPAEWILYPNGIDPAPVATGDICSEPAVVYAAPQKEAPDAPQALVLRTLTDPPRSTTIATAKAFFSVSMAGLERGALVAYVADWATWAVTVRCREAAK